MWSKIIDPRISRRWFWGLVLDASFAQQRPIIVCTCRCPQRRRDRR